MVQHMLKIGLIGYGALGQTVASILSASGCGVISAVLLQAPPRNPDVPVPVALGMDKFLAFGHDVVIECASQEPLRQHAAPIPQAGVHLVPASAGALADDRLREAVQLAALEGNAQVRLPSGAMVGIDGLLAARAVGIERVLYRSTMPPGVLKSHLGDAPVIERTLAFTGTAREAVGLYPKNANLTATIALAASAWIGRWSSFISTPQSNTTCTSSRRPGPSVSPAHASLASASRMPHPCHASSLGVMRRPRLS